MVYSTASEANAIPLYAKAAVNTKKKIPPALLTEIRFFFAIGHITDTVFSIREFPPWLRAGVLPLLCPLLSVKHFVLNAVTPDDVKAPPKPILRSDTVPTSKSSPANALNDAVP